MAKGDASKIWVAMADEARCVKVRWKLRTMTVQSDDLGFKHALQSVLHMKCVLLAVEPGAGLEFTLRQILSQSAVFGLIIAGFPQPPTQFRRHRNLRSRRDAA